MWSTRNTRLAAALLALGFKLDNKPFTHGIANSEINFDDELDKFESAWAHRDDWAYNHPEHPFTYMRKAADAYEWMVNKVIYGNYDGIAEMSTRRVYVTSDIRYACCLIAMNFFLIQIDRASRRFVFSVEAWNHLTAYKSIESDSQIAWMRRYLEKHDWLKREIKQSRLDSAITQRQSCAT